MKYNIPSFYLYSGLNNYHSTCTPVKRNARLNRSLLWAFREKTKKLRNVLKYNFLNFKYFFKIVEDLEELGHALQKILRVFLFRAKSRERRRQTCGCVEKWVFSTKIQENHDFFSQIIPDHFKILFIFSNF